MFDEPSRLMLKFVIVGRNNWKPSKTTKAKMIAFEAWDLERFEYSNDFNNYNCLSRRHAVASTVWHVYQMRRNERAIYAKERIGKVRVSWVNEYVRGVNDFIKHRIHHARYVWTTVSISLKWRFGGHPLAFKISYYTQVKCLALQTASRKFLSLSLLDWLDSDRIFRCRTVLRAIVIKHIFHRLNRRGDGDGDRNGNDFWAQASETEDKFRKQTKVRFVSNATAILLNKFYDSYRAQYKCAIKVVTRFNRS